MISSYKAIGFDMDGTLMNTHIDYQKMADLIFDEMVRVGVPESKIDRTQGSTFNIDSGVRYLMENGRANELYEIEARISKAARDIEMENAGLARPFPGAMELLVKLKNADFKVGVLTRSCREVAEYVLKMCNVYEHLDGLVCRDDFPEKDAKPSPKAMENLGNALGVKPADILYVGDHSFDHACAKAAGAGFIGVLTGGYTKEKWNTLDDKIDVINTIADLLSYL